MWHYSGIEVKADPGEAIRILGAEGMNHPEDGISGIVGVNRRHLPRRFDRHMLGDSLLVLIQVQATVIHLDEDVLVARIGAPRGKSEIPVSVLVNEVLAQDLPSILQTVTIGVASIGNFVAVNASN